MFSLEPIFEPRSVEVYSLCFFVGIAILILALSRVPAPLAAGLPSIVGLVFVTNPEQTIRDLPITALSVLVDYQIAGLVLWFFAGALIMESGVFTRHMTGLYALLGRALLTDEVKRWSTNIHGLPGTLISLLFVASVFSKVDPHILTILFCIIGALVGGLTLISLKLQTRDSNTLSVSRIQDRKGKSKKIPLSITVYNENGEALTLSSRSQALAMLSPLTVLALFELVVLVFSPATLTDLAAFATPLILVICVVSAHQVSWLTRVPPRFFMQVGLVVAQLVGAVFVVDFMQKSGLFANVNEILSWGGFYPLGAFVLAFLFALSIGTVFGPETGAVLAFGLFGGAFNTELINIDFFTRLVGAQELQVAVLNALLAVVITLGALISRTIPPFEQPWPLERAPVVGSGLPNSAFNGQH